MWDDGTIWEGARLGMLLLQRCADCAELCHPPLPMCPQCQSTRRTTQRCSGAAVVKGWLVSTHPNRPEDAARLVVVVELAEGGVRLVSNLHDIALDEIYEGMPVRLFFETVDGVALPRFRPAEREPSAP